MNTKIVFISSILLLFFVACKDNLGTLGESILPQQNDITAHLDTLHIDFSTEEMPSSYARSTTALLGEINDESYGNLKCDYICQLRAPKNFAFRKEPIDGKIDSVRLVVRYNNWVGDSTSVLKAKIYEIKQPLKKSYYSEKDISSYMTERNFLSEKKYIASDSNHVIVFPLNNAIGQRFYEASKKHPDYFNSQESFYKNLLGGLYVTTTTGQGSILNVEATELWIFYHYKGTFTDSNGKDSIGSKPAAEMFTNTPELALVRHFEQDRSLSKYIGSAEKHGGRAFIKSPDGLIVKGRISKEDLTRVFLNKKGKDGQFKTSIINEAYLGLKIEDNSKNTFLDPPTFLSLMPKDSVVNYIVQSRTEISNPETIFLSSSFSIKTPFYNFNNIAYLILKHLSNPQNIKIENGKQMLLKDLEFVLLPISRETLSGKDDDPTLELQNLLFPMACTLIIDKKAREMPVVYSTANINGFKHPF